MVTETNEGIPDKLEYIRRKKLLEKEFLENTCRLHNLDQEKARFAIESGILVLEPSLYEWDKHEWAKESVSWAEGFNISSIAKKAEIIKIPKGQSSLGKLVKRIHFDEFKQKLIDTIF